MSEKKIQTGVLSTFEHPKQGVGARRYSSGRWGWSPVRTFGLPTKELKFGACGLSDALGVLRAPGSTVASASEGALESQRTIVAMFQTPGIGSRALKIRGD